MTLRPSPTITAAEARSQHEQHSTTDCDERTLSFTVPSPVHGAKKGQQLWHLTLVPQAKGRAEPQEKVLTPPQFADWGPLPPQGDVGRGRSRRRDSQPDRTAGFPEPRLTCQGGGNPGKAEDAQGEWHRRSVRPLRPTGSREGGGRRTSRPLPAAPRGHTRETLASPPTQQASGRPPSRGPAQPGKTGGVVCSKQPRAQGAAPPLSLQSHARAGPAPERRRESPPPPRAPGLRSPPPPAPRATPLRPPPPSHIHTPPARLLYGKPRRSAPQKYTPSSPALPASRLPAPTPARRALTAKLLRPLLTACPSRREPQAQQGGPENRTGHRPAKAGWQPPLR
ncbi:basic salivary proline-rich protein 2-like [Hippopotamus amphibius kiboko]|uniref:basic salivary proline-rich protein 2-like n=1 Tax=Hippopotamus amphibius kiboko TaxID=575201 RepID=UPI00259273B8|nr:basic salivary proline-rich protein 2-like [Hippopotamus amphibius kiboko]